MKVELSTLPASHASKCELCWDVFPGVPICARSLLVWHPLVCSVGPTARLSGYPGLPSTGNHPWGGLPLGEGWPPHRHLRFREVISALLVGLFLGRILITLPWRTLQRFRLLALRELSWFGTCWGTPCTQLQLATGPAPKKLRSH